MNPILAGLATAFAFAVSTLVSARASRLAGPQVTVAGAMSVGLVLVLPVALLATPLPPVPPGTLVLDVAAGAANVGGLLLAYTAYTVGAVGIVSTIASTEGAIAAMISVLAGEQLAPGSGATLGIIALGVVLAAPGGGGELEEGRRISRARSLRAAGLAVAAAGLFGSGLFLTATVGASLPTAWILLPARATGALFVGIPLVVMGRAHVPRRAVPFVIACGICEVVGFTTFVAGSQVDIAVTAVLASMFAPIAAVAAFLLFGERLSRRQISGIALVVTGIALLGAVSG
jgi:drug/metabolite transporter (DMT)-like permease